MTYCRARLLYAGLSFGGAGARRDRVSNLGYSVSGGTKTWFQELTYQRQQMPSDEPCRFEKNVLFFLLSSSHFNWVIADTKDE